MLWSANPPFLAWLIYMVASYALFVVVKRCTHTGKNLPLTHGNFGKEQTFWQTIAGFLRNSTAAAFFMLVIAAWTARVAIGRWHWLDLLAAFATLVLWPFAEWLVHVALHAQPHKICGMTFDSIFAKIHRAHHRHPNHPTFGVVPVSTLVQYFLIVPGIIFLFLRWPRSFTMAAMAATLAFRYELWHYFYHSSYKPQSAWFRTLRDRHLWHHFQHEGYWFGVTTTAADSVLRTNPDPKAVGHSPTAKTLDHCDAA